MINFSLARKYRPQSFAELCGQETTVLSLANAIKRNAIPQAIVLSGIRGVGKTTIARLLAKSVNCSNGPSITPCQACDSCRAITAGHHEDVVEVDGASNNSVDEVRTLQETVHYLPQRSIYKVYIIDEVHMLSVSAFNALLKTLEEPPARTIFILATTELTKIPKTVVSRCLNFQLNTLSNEIIFQRLIEILQKENISFDEKAVRLIARDGRGSLRDAITLLDQAISLGDGNVLLEQTQKMLGGASYGSCLDVLFALVKKEPSICCQKIEEFEARGLSYMDLTTDLAKLARFAFLVRDLKDEHVWTKHPEFVDQDRLKINEIGQAAAAFDLNRIFRMLVQCRKDMDGSELDRFILENYMLEWCLDPGFPDFFAQHDEKEENKKQASERPGSYSKQEVAKSTAPVRLAEAPIVKTEPRNIIAELIREQKTDPIPFIKPLEIEKAAIISEPLPKQKEEPLPLTAKPTLEEATDKFPKTWEELVLSWKKNKPLQARKLEEVYPLEYNKEKIRVGVKQDSMVGQLLLNKSAQDSLREQFTALFSFYGILEIVPLSQEVHADKEKKESLPVSILEQRKEQERFEREQTISEIKNSDFVKGFLQTFDAEILQITHEDLDQNIGK